MEMFDTFFTEPYLQANNCKFRALREKLKWDGLVVGIWSYSIRSRHLREADLTLQKAIDICQAGEVTDLRMASMKSSMDNQTNQQSKTVNV